MDGTRMINFWILTITWTTLCFVTMTTSQECSAYTAYAVVDGSASISVENFNTVKVALTKFINESISRNPAVRIGIVVYDENITNVVTAESNITSLSVQIDAIEHPGKTTATHLGIEKATTLLEHDPYPHLKAMIVITDGLSGEPTLTAQAASDARDKGMTMFAVGIDHEEKKYSGRYEDYKQELYNITDSTDRVYRMDGFSNLTHDMMRIVHRLCLLEEMTASSVSPFTENSVSVTAATETMVTAESTDGTATSVSSLSSSPSTTSSSSVSTTTTTTTMENMAAVAAGTTTRTTNGGGGADYVVIVSAVAGSIAFVIAVVITVVVYIEGRKRGNWKRPKHPHAKRLTTN